MPDIIDMIAGAYADKAALIHGESSWTWTELNARANAFARGLLGLGLTPGNKVVWIGPNHEKVILFGHASRKAQLISVPLNYRFSQDEMAYVINDSDAVLVFCDPEYRATLESIDIAKVKHIVDYDDAEKLIAANAGEPLDASSEGLGSSMIYTSGTTGNPKGALRQGVDPTLVGHIITEIRWTSDDVHITTGPLYHSGPGGFSGLAHILGGTIVIMPKFDAMQWLELVDRHKVSTTFTAPTQMKRLLEVPEDVRKRYDTSSLRSIIANAAPIPYALKVAWIERFGEGHLFEVYGSTELGVDTILKPEEQLARPGSCGRPYGGIEIRLITEDGRDANIGEPGEMWIRTPGAFDEYYKATEKTEGTMLSGDPNWRSVGDIAYRDEDGYYYVCDRKADMIISGGMNIYPAEIEAVLHSHPAVMDAAVFGIPSEEWGESVHATIQLKEGATATPDEFEQLCRERLAGYKVPRSIEFTETLPRTESGKLLKRLLRDEYWKDRDTRV